MRFHAISIVVPATFCVVLGNPMPLPAQALEKPAAVCQSALGKALFGFKKAKLKAWTRCLDASLEGDSCDAVARDDATDAAAAKARATIEAKCPGTSLFGASPAGVGFAPTCEFGSGDLSAAEQACAALPVDSAGDLAECLLCWKQAEIDRLLETLYPCLDDTIPDGALLDCGVAPAACPDPGTAGDEIACLRSVSRAATKWFLTYEKSLEKCLNAVRSGKLAGSCPDSATSDKLARATQNALVSIIGGDCDRLPSFWDVCPIDPLGPCSEDIESVPDLAVCVVEASEQLANRLICRQYPGSGADGIDCCMPSGELDVCNGLDDDCDPTSADGSEDPLSGTACDGPDSDLCGEGLYACSAAALVCSDASDDSLDLCNGIDDDCDAGSADGAEDPTMGMACDGDDTDLCVEGTSTCAAGPVCSDTTGSTVELCDGTGADEDCDGQIDEDFNRNNNPSCSIDTVYLGSIAGDQILREELSASAFDERWYRVTIREDNSSTVNLTATVSLNSHPQSPFNFHVYCLSCGGTVAGSSVGPADYVEVRRDDTVGDQTFDILIQVWNVYSTLCANWELRVLNSSAATTATCP